MSRLLKGNYSVGKKKKRVNQIGGKSGSPVTEEFEKRAIEHLGGSIAFVQKKGVFLWDGASAIAPKKGSRRKK